MSATNEDNLKREGMSMMFLLFEEKCEMPSSEKVYQLLTEKGYKVNAEWVSNDKEFHIFYLPEYIIDFEDAKNVPYQLCMCDITEAKKDLASDMAKAQFWKTPNGNELLETCQWQVMIGDFMSSQHDPKVRAQILSDWLDIALELFSTCKAVWFDGSQNIMNYEDLKNNPYEGHSRIFYGALNARFFRVGELDEFIVDTLGMNTFGIPDVQLHFQNLNPNNVVGLAYDVALYQFENNIPIADGETISGFDEEGNYKEDIKWKCQYKVAIIEPKRDVLDINAGIYAAGNRK